MSRVGREQVDESFWSWEKKRWCYRKVYKRPDRPNFIREGNEIYLRIDDKTKVMVATKEDAILELQRFACRLGTTRYHRLLIKARKLPLPWTMHERTVVLSNLTNTKWVCRTQR